MLFRSAYRSSNAKASRSPPRRKSNSMDWRKEKFNATNSYPPFGPPMPMSWIHPYADIYPYPSWDMYGSWARYPSYSRSSHQNYAAPRRSAQHQQSDVNDRFNKKESVQSSWKKEVIKQVYRVKKDGRKCAVLDSTPNIEKSAKLTLARK